MLQRTGFEFPRTIEDEYEDILNLGKIFDCEDKAEEIVDQMKGEIDKVKEHVEGTDPLSVAVLEDEEIPSVYMEQRHLAEIFRRHLVQS